jgi:hypothetical protein
MSRKIARLFILSLLFSRLWAQADPPPILKIVREDMKPGTGAAHEKNEAAFAQAFRATSFPNYFGWEALTGQTQVWFLEGFANYAGIEAAMKIMGTEPLRSTLGSLEVKDSELRTGERTTLARYRKDLSYLPEPLNLAKTRYVWVDIVKIQTGHAEEYREMRKTQIAALEQAGARWKQVVYALGNDGYLVMRPLESLSELDAPQPRMVRNPGIILSSEEILFAVNPKMSNPPKSYLDLDAAFWGTK